MIDFKKLFSLEVLMIPLLFLAGSIICGYELKFTAIELLKGFIIGAYISPELKLLFIRAYAKLLLLVIFLEFLIGIYINFCPQ